MVNKRQKDKVITETELFRRLKNIGWHGVNYWEIENLTVVDESGRELSEREILLIVFRAAKNLKKRYARSINKRKRQRESQEPGMHSFQAAMHWHRFYSGFGE